MNRCIFLLGSNLGDKEKNISDAISEISQQVGIISAKSHYYESGAWGFESSQSFYNLALISETILDADKTLETALMIEKIAGRIRTKKYYTDRIIDIDILFFNYQIIYKTHLIVPHPLLIERKFALSPLCEICPDFVHPVFNKTIQELLHLCKDQTVVKKLTP